MSLVSEFSNKFFNPSPRINGLIGTHTAPMAAHAQYVSYNSLLLDNMVATLSPFVIPFAKNAFANCVTALYRSPKVKRSSP